MIEGTDEELQISCVESEAPKYFPGDSQPTTKTTTMNQAIYEDLLIWFVTVVV